MPLFGSAPAVRRVNRTPYARPDPSSGIPASNFFALEREVAQSVVPQHSEPRSFIGSLTQRLRSALGSLWAPEETHGTDESMVKSRYTDQIRLANDRTPTVPPVLHPGPENALAWRSEPPQRFDLASFTDLSRLAGANGSLNLNHSLVIAAYREKLMDTASRAPAGVEEVAMEVDVSNVRLPSTHLKTEFRNEAEPGYDPTATKLKTETKLKTVSNLKTETKLKTETNLKTEKNLKTETNLKTEVNLRAEENLKTRSAKNQDTGSNSYSSGKRTLKRTGTPPTALRKLPRIDVERERREQNAQRLRQSRIRPRTALRAPVRDNGLRIQLVTKPVVDLRTLPESRKTHPGYISANFDVSDDEDDATVQSAPIESSQLPSLTRRPATDSLKTTRLREKAAAASASASTALTESHSSSAGSRKPSASLTAVDSDVIGSIPVPKRSVSLSSRGAVQEKVATNEEPAFAFGKLTSGAKSDHFAAQKRGREPESGEQPSIVTAEVAKSKTEKPSFSFADNPADSKKPAFSFGAKHADAEKPAFSFGAKNADAEKPTFSFGAKPAGAEKPSLNFGNKSKPAGAETKEATVEKPAEAPAFIFGSTSASQPEQNPTLNSGASKSNGMPSLNFGSSATEKPAFTFGSTPAAPAAPVEKSSAGTPAFSFGEKLAKNDKHEESKQKDATKPAFSFGITKPMPSATAAAVTTPAETPQPEPSSNVAFGDPVGSSKPAFSFGTSAAGLPSQPSSKAASEPSKTAEPQGGSTSTGFTFGANSNKESTPFNFNSTPASSTPTAGFMFGSNTATANGSDKPGFGFGANTGAGQGSNTDVPQTITSGENGPAPTNKPTGFGAVQAPATFSFGTNLNGSAPSSATMPNQSTNSTFGFGSGSGSTTAGAPTGGFTFGANSAPPTISGDSASALNTGFAFGANSGSTSRQGTPLGAGSGPASANSGSFTFGALGGNTGAAVPALPPAANTGLSMPPMASNGMPGAPNGVPPGRRIAQPRRRLQRR